MAQKRFGVDINLQKNQLVGARVENLAGAPASPVVGQIYVETTGGVNRLYVYNGTAWVLRATDSDALGGQTLAQVRDFSQTTGQRTALSAISDFDTQVRTSRLDQMAAPTGAVALNAQKITGLADPTSAQDAATKNYVDNAVNGFDWKASVRVATTANLAALSGLLTIDGVTVVAGDRVLVKDQTTGSANGIYVAASGAWARAADASTSAQVTPGMATFVEEGTTNGNQQWVLTTDGPITLGTTALVFAQVGAQSAAPTAGTGLTLSGNTYNVNAGATPGSGGPGGGLVANADDLVIDTTIVARKYISGTIGDGTTTAFTITHNLANQWVTVAVIRVSDGSEEFVDAVRTSASVVTVTFNTAPAANTYRVVVVG